MNIKSWRTTIAGLAVIIGGIFLIAHSKEGVQGGVLIAAGIGLLNAKDYNKSHSNNQTEKKG